MKLVSEEFLEHLLECARDNDGPVLLSKRAVFLLAMELRDRRRADARDNSIQVVQRPMRERVLRSARA